MGARGVREDLGGVGGAGRARYGGRGEVGAEEGADALGGGDRRGVRVHADAVGDDPQGVRQVLGAGALVRVLAQAALDHRPQRVRHGGGAARLGAQMLVQHLQGAATAERGTAGDQLVEHDPGAVDVHGGGLRAALGGLRRDVRGRADELLGAGQARGVGEAGDAEVGEHRVHLAAGLLQQDVGRLEVAVDHAVGVAGGERVRDLGGQQGGGDGGEGTVLPQVAVQVGAVDEVHDEGEQIALDDQVPHPDDVRVGEPEQDGALPQEAHHDVRVARELLLEDLDRDGLARPAGDGRLGARGLALARTPHRARGAASERLLEQVLAAYRPHVMGSLLIGVSGPYTAVHTPLSTSRTVLFRASGPGSGPRLRAPGVPTHCSAVPGDTGLSSPPAARGRRSPPECSVALPRRYGPGALRVRRFRRFRGFRGRTLGSGRLVARSVAGRSPVGLRSVVGRSRGGPGVTPDRSQAGFEWSFVDRGRSLGGHFCGQSRPIKITCPRGAGALSVAGARMPPVTGRCARERWGEPRGKVRGRGTAGGAFVPARGCLRRRDR